MAVRSTDAGDERRHRGGRVGVVVEVDDQQAAELALPPVGQNGVGERSLEADHDDRTDLFGQPHPTGSELLGRARAGDRAGSRRRRGSYSATVAAGDQKDRQECGHCGERARQDSLRIASSAATPR